MERKFLVYFILLLSSSIFFLQCSTSRQNGFVKEDIKKYKIQTIAILEFDDANSAKYKKYHPEASRVATDTIQNAFLDFGYKIVERNKLDKILQEKHLSLSGITIEDGIQVGKLLNADVVVMGSLTAYMQGQHNTEIVKEIHGNDDFGNLIRTQFGFTIKGIHVQSGEMLFSGSYFKEKNGILNYTDPILGLVNEMIYEDLMDQWKDKGLTNN